MANELRVRQNFLGGLIEDNPLTAAATTLTSAALAAMSVIGTTQHMSIVLDPDGLYGEPEIAYITAHTASATTATLLRGQEGTTAREHKQNLNWVHGPTIHDIEGRYAKVTRLTGADQSLTSGTALVVSWTSEVTDTHGMFDAAAPTRITLNRAGLWILNAKVTFSGNATGVRVIEFRMNGATTAGFIRQPPPGAATAYVGVTEIWTSNGTDYVEVLATQDSGVALTMPVFNPHVPVFSATYVTGT